MAEENQNQSEQNQKDIESPNPAEKQEHSQNIQNNELQKEFQNLKEKHLRLQADFENFRRRVQQDQALWSDQAQSQVLNGLLPVIDDFDRAISEAQKHEISPELEAWLKGFVMIHASLHKALQQLGVQEIKEIQIFDPTIHEALLQVDSPDKESGAIVDVIQKGYRFKDTVLRPAKVAVAK